MTPKKKKDRGLFEYQERMANLNEYKIPLDKLNYVIDWEIFRSVSTDVFEVKEQKYSGGASHFDYIFMFKILIFKRFYGCVMITVAKEKPNDNW